MKPRLHISLLAAASLLTFALGAPCQAATEAPSADKATSYSEEDKDLLDTAQGLFQALPDAAAMQKLRPFTDAQVRLGQQLWFEPRLSRGNTVSCNSCHNLASAGVDNLPTSAGHKGQFGARNSPTALNAALLGHQFWDGRAADVEEQAGGPLLNPVEMANVDEATVEKKIASIPEYLPLFQKAFPDSGKNPVTFQNIRTAIGAFERTLLTPSPWDKYLQGDIGALTAQQRKGLSTFIDSGCATCHKGVGLGGDTFQKFGMVNAPYWKYTQSPKQDEGRFEVTKKEDDKYFFRVPGLRNVARTYPYFHDGSVWELDQAIRVMAQTQLGQELNKEQVADIAAFLQSLSGPVPESARIIPELPISVTQTPHPDNQ